MSFAHRSVISRNLCLPAWILASSTLSINASAGVIASTNFETTGSIPAITWTPTLQLGAGVPSSASSFASLTNNGTVDVKTNTGAKPVPVGVKTKSMSMNADFSGVSATATSWSATMKTPLLDIVNYESYLGKLDLSFDLSANRPFPVKVRIESFNSSNAPTGYREATILPVATNATYRYCIDLSTMTAGANDFKPVGTDGDKIQISVILTGTSTDSQSWPRGAGGVYNQVYIDNITYTSPAYYVSQNGGGTGSGINQANPAKLADIIKIAQPGDVILLNGDTYTGTLEIDRISGTPSRWITLRSNPTSTAPIFRSKSWNTIRIFANVSYLNLQGLRIHGYLKDQAEINAGLTLTNATIDGEKINTTTAHPNDPAYTNFADGGNEYSGNGKFNVNGIFLDGFRKKIPSGANYIQQLTPVTEGIHHIRVADCLIYENTGAGLVTMKGDYFIFENNVIYDNNRYCRFGGSGISSLWPVDFDGGNGYKIYVNGNVSHNNGGWVRWGPRHSVDPTTGQNSVAINFSDGNGIIIDSHNHFEYSGRTLVQNNLVYENGGSGIHALKSDRVDIVNNTAYRNSKPNGAPNTVLSRRWVQQPVLGSNPPVYALAANPPYATYVNQPPSYYTDGGESLEYGQIFSDRGSDVRISNNVLWASSGQPINAVMSSGEVNVSYDSNLFGRDGGNAAAGTSTTGFTTFNYNIIESTGVASNVFANITNPSTSSTYLHLKTTAPVSPAINAGNIWAAGAPRNDLNGIRRPRGSNTDMGAFEDL